MSNELFYLHVIIEYGYAWVAVLPLSPSHPYPVWVWIHHVIPPPCVTIPTTTTTDTHLPKQPPQKMSFLPEKVTVAPLVLLSVVDHFNRVSTNGKKRVMGVILGEKVNSPLATANASAAAGATESEDNSASGGAPASSMTTSGASMSELAQGTVNVTNSFAVPFEEDPKNPDIWYLDQHYIHGMLEMFKKIDARERLLGWYHSGPRLRGADMAITQLFKKFVPNPLLLIVDVEPSRVGLPTDAYYVIDEIKADGTSAGKTFHHIPSDIKAEEAEEIGVEHLLRDVDNAAAGTLATRISQQLSSLEALNDKLKDIARYLDRVLNNQLPLNHAVLGELQNVFNLLPTVNSLHNKALQRAFTTKTNDQMMIVYLSSLVRAVISFHDMIDNKIQNKKQVEASASGSTANTATAGEVASK